MGVEVTLVWKAHTPQLLISFGGILRRSFCDPYGDMPVRKVSALRAMQRYGFQPICPSLDGVYQKKFTIFIFFYQISSETELES